MLLRINYTSQVPTHSIQMKFNKFSIGDLASISLTIYCKQVCPAGVMYNFIFSINSSLFLSYRYLSPVGPPNFECEMV